MLPNLLFMSQDILSRHCCLLGPFNYSFICMCYNTNWHTFFKLLRSSYQITQVSPENYQPQTKITSNWNAPPVWSGVLSSWYFRTDVSRLQAPAHTPLTLQLLPQHKPHYLLLLMPNILPEHWSRVSVSKVIVKRLLVQGLAQLCPARARIGYSCLQPSVEDKWWWEKDGWQFLMAASFYAEGSLYLVSYFKAYHTNIQYSTKYNQQFLDVYNQLFYWIFLEHRTIVGNHALGCGPGGVEGRVQVIYNSVQLFLSCAPFPSLEVFSAPPTSFPSIKCTAFILESDSKQVIKHKHEKLCRTK